MSVSRVGLDIFERLGWGFLMLFAMRVSYRCNIVLFERTVLIMVGAVVWFWDCAFWQVIFWKPFSALVFDLVP